MVPLAISARFTLVAATMLTALAGSATAADLRGRAPVPYQPRRLRLKCLIGAAATSAVMSAAPELTGTPSLPIEAIRRSELFQADLLEEGPRAATLGMSARTAASSGAVRWAVTGRQSAHRSFSELKERLAT